MKENWTYKKLKHYISEYSVKNRNDEDIPVYSVTNSQGFCREYFSKEVASKDKTTYKIVPRGFFAYNPSRINVGSIDWQDKEDKVIVSPLYIVFEVSKELLQKYLLYYIKSHNTMAQINAAATGSVRANLKLSMLGDFSIPVPPLSEQSRIVSELDLLQSIIDKQQAQLKELDTLAQAVFYDMFGDLEASKYTLIELCDSKDDIKCGPFGTQLSKTEYQKSGVAVWGIPQINSHFKIPPSDYVSEEKAINLKDYSVIAGDIVMSRKGNVGQCCVFPKSFSSGIIHSDVLRLRLNPHKADPLFMMYQLHLSKNVKYQIQLVSSGAIMPGINVTKLKNIVVEVPPLPLQQSFAAKIESIEKQKAAISQSIAETEKLFEYTMDKYFN